MAEELSARTSKVATAKSAKVVGERLRAEEQQCEGGSG